MAAQYIAPDSVQRYPCKFEPDVTDVMFTRGFTPVSRHTVEIDRRFPVYAPLIERRKRQKPQKAYKTTPVSLWFLFRTFFPLRFTSAGLVDAVTCVTVFQFFPLIFCYGSFLFCSIAGVAQRAFQLCFASQPIVSDVLPTISVHNVCASERS